MSPSETAMIKAPIAPIMRKAKVKRSLSAHGRSYFSVKVEILSQAMPIKTAKV
jgi:hypothetical protein